ncbi:MAG: hypothetical protein HYV09_03460 [Deltaproteobacteria bacterium]|nr:hypothetical protein [Deltaproteobacteria bacterium]
MPNELSEDEYADEVSDFMPPEFVADGEDYERWRAHVRDCRARGLSPREYAERSGVRSR